MKSVDQYIRRATAGLPTRAKADTAAELRVHLNQRIKQFVDEGFGQDEAVHLTLEQMGPAEPVNRSFLGHALNPKVGWVTLIILALGVGTWFTANYLFAPAEVATRRDVTVSEILPLLGDFASMDVTFPRGAQLLATALVQGGSPLYTSDIRLSEQAASLKPNERITVPVTLGLLNENLAPTTCVEGSRPWLSIEGTYGRSASCVDLPSDSGRWAYLTPVSAEMQLDTWVPLLVYQPTVVVDEVRAGVRSLAQQADGHLVAADAGAWLALSVYATEAPLSEMSSTPPPPTVVEILEHRPYRAMLE